MTLDLTGLAPSLEELDAFLSDKSPDAYPKVVDRLLASPWYGGMTVIWLDLARYADSDGYQDDEPRIMWHWRDWLINALNNNLPFDQFTIEQLAGDLIPEERPRSTTGNRLPAKQPGQRRRRVYRRRIPGRIHGRSGRHRRHHLAGPHGRLCTLSRPQI